MLCYPLQDDIRLKVVLLWISKFIQKTLDGYPLYPYTTHTNNETKGESMNIITDEDAAKLETKLKGCVVESVTHAEDDTSIELYFTNGLCVSISGEEIEDFSINAKLEVELRES